MGACTSIMSSTPSDQLGSPRRRRGSSRRSASSPATAGSTRGFGTIMRLIPLADDRYLEIVEVLDHPAADKAPYGQAVRARSELGGGWLGWVVAVDDLAPFEARLDRPAVAGLRYFPDGRALEWRQIGVKGLIADPQLPYFCLLYTSPSP